MPNEVVDLWMRHHSLMERAIDDRDRQWPGQASKKLADGVRRRDDGHGGRNLERDPVENEIGGTTPRREGSTKARRVGSDLDMESRARRLKAPEQRER